MFILLTINLTLSFMFFMFKHPISLMMIILLQTFSTCMLCGMMINLWWFSYMLFMVMIGGILVLFMYMTNVASNEKFESKKIKNLLMKMTLCTAIILYLLKDNFYFYTQTHNWINLNKNCMEIIIMKYYNYPSNMIMFLMMIFLLLTMIMTVKVTDTKSGALRQKF
uniref:NADH-ubiquinone oxidoreductase chain 6 n=1 Tax=Laccoptera ruginosa TaxID=1205597 RepID=A0A0S2MP05_9CUCU|nr:NADH deshydrogenase subunit 6 [Laccoptera ruginosa]